MRRRLCSLAGTSGNCFKLGYFLNRRSVTLLFKCDILAKTRELPFALGRWSYDGACTVISNAERWDAKRDTEIEALRAAIIKAELLRAQAENHLLRQRVLDLEKALVRREGVVKFAQIQASEVARLKDKNKELRFKLRQMWDWHNDEITKTGGLTFKASSLIAKALHPDAPPSEEVRLEAFKAFSAWKSDRHAAKRR
jgi:hypothetical protein